jgi:sterol desaturase/sphingolipid hydroxylase (fatty acid hydroxylase superfamily)
MKPGRIQAMSKFEFLMAVLLGGLVLLSLIERFRPRRPRPGKARWPNVALGVCSHVIGRAVVPVGLGAFAMHWRAGLLHAVALPLWLKVVLGVLMLDLVKYGQHVIFHTVPFFWRFHRVHHSDQHLDTTTAFRFHPGQTLISVGISVLAVMALGLPMGSVFAFALLHELILLTTHTNLDVAHRLDRGLRLVVVSPRMHWIHHSAAGPRELDHNFGICFSWWDRLFGTYRARSTVGDLFAFGIEDQPDDASSFLHLLMLPIGWQAVRDNPASRTSAQP